MKIYTSNTCTTHRQKDLTLSPGVILMLGIFAGLVQISSSRFQGWCLVCWGHPALPDDRKNTLCWRPWTVKSLLLILIGKHPFFWDPYISFCWPHYCHWQECKRHCKIEGLWRSMGSGQATQPWILIPCGIHDFKFCTYVKIFKQQDALMSALSFFSSSTSFLGTIWYTILTIDGTARVVWSEHKETRLPWADPQITLWSCGQVLDSEPKTKDQCRGSSKAWVFYIMSRGSEKAKASQTWA